MKKKLLGLLIVFIVAVPFSSEGKVLDRVVAVVDGDVITLSDLDQAVTKYGKNALQGGENALDKALKLSRIRKRVLEQVIEDKVLQKISKRHGIKVKDEEVDEAIEQIKRQGRVTEAELQKELAAAGFTVEGYREFLTAQIRRGRIVDYFVKPKISLDDERIREYYQRHKEKFRRPSQVRVSHIFIQVAPNAEPPALAAAKEKMARALQRLGEGVGFEEVALLYSEDVSARSGGDLGFFKKGEMDPVLEGLVFEMPVGAVSGVARSSRGLHVLTVTER